MLGVKVAAFRADHDGHVSDGHAGFGGGWDTVSLDGEVNGYRGHVGQFSQSAFHGRRWVECTVGLFDRGLAEFDVFETDDDVLVVDVEFDVTTFVVVEVFIGSDANVANDALHTRDGVL